MEMAEVIPCGSLVADARRKVTIPTRRFRQLFQTVLLPHFTSHPPGFPGKMMMEFCRRRRLVHVHGIRDPQVPGPGAVREGTGEGAGPAAAADHGFGRGDRTAVRAGRSAEDGVPAGGGPGLPRPVPV